MIMARNEDGTYSQVGFVKDNVGIDTEYIYDKDGDIVFEKGFTRETSGTVPLTINGIGKDLKAWSITGNTVQNGTPTPENPVEVQAVGDKTGNLFDYKKYFKSTFTKYSEYFEWAEIQLKPFTTYTFTTSFSESTIPGGVINTAFIITTSTEEPHTSTGGISSTRIGTKTTEADGIIKIYKRIRGNYLPKKEDFDSGMHWLMINEGDSALPYEPYGYKIPVVTRGKNLAGNYTVSSGYYYDDSGTPTPSDARFIRLTINVEPNTIYTISSNLKFYSIWEFNNNTKISRRGGGNSNKYTIKTTKECNSLRISMSNTSGEADTSAFEWIQLEKGSTATPYEPYHETITTPIYLDSPLYKIGDYADRLSKTEEVRVVKELVLTGKEDIFYGDAYTRFRVNIADFETFGVRATPFYMSHYIVVSDGRPLPDVPDNAAYSGSSSDNHCIFIKTTNYTTVADFKSYLAAQYAAGTPVKVYYVLATPETKTVEPVEIPTLNGTTVIDVDTTVKLTEMYTKYKSSK